MAASERGDRAAGFTFVPPPQWEVHEEEGRFLLAYPQIEAIVVVTAHTATDLEEVRDQLLEGWTEPGIELLPAGDPRPWGDAGLALDLAGQMQSQQARASLLCLMSPHGGGVLILGVGPAAAGDQVSAVVEEIATGVAFPEPDPTALIERWDGLIRGKLLTHMASDHSTGVGFGGEPTFTGWSERRDILLHADGTFEASGVSTGAITPGATWQTPTGPSSGTWRVTAQAGQPLLELQAVDGTTTQVLLERRDDATYLDGVRFFVTEP